MGRKGKPEMPKVLANKPAGEFSIHSGAKQLGNRLFSLLKTQRENKQLN
jgi:hypothetical protein